MADNIEPEVFAKVFGPASAVALLTMLYAGIVKILCYAGAQKIQRSIILAE